jgi:hypothetical protein
MPKDSAQQASRASAMRIGSERTARDWTTRAGDHVDETDDDDDDE